MLKQLTIRGFDPELARRIKALAERERISLNQAALRLLRKGAGLSRDQGDEPDDQIGTSLDRFIGTWSDAEAHEFDEAVRDFEQIDDSLWQ